MLLAGRAVDVTACPEVVDIPEVKVDSGLSAVVTLIALVDVVVVSSSGRNSVVGTGAVRVVGVPGTATQYQTLFCKAC